MMDTLAPLTFGAVARMAAGFFVFVTLLWLGTKFLPGRTEKGVVLPDGTQKSYKLNGLNLLLAVIVMVAAASVAGFSLAWVARNVLAALLVTNIFAVLVSLVLYFQGRRAGCRSGGAPAGFLRGLYLGVERNPSWLGVDLKFFSYRPSLIGLALFNVSFAVLQYERYGMVTPEMITYQVLYFGYIVNYFQFEYGMIFTWDIIEERFGGMLVWGDYVYVPFFYSLPGWYLVDRLQPLPTAALLGIIGLYLLGFWMFRGANEQKHTFRRDPTAKIWGHPPRVVGDRLLASGFWGIGRKLNYTGELMMYCAWTLLSGFTSWVPYLLPAALLVLFVHRALRRRARNRRVHGGQYCRIARFRMFPFIY